MRTEPAADAPHDLESFLDEVASGLKVDYSRIRKSARSDPGTAGDQSEATWADLFRSWLPTSLQVVTKGRIAARDGRLSEQLDVIVLRDTYPPHLAKKKVYLAGGVLAVFECKLTLRKSHIADAVERGRSLRALVGPRKGKNLRDELVPPILYGLLAHQSEGLDVEAILKSLDEGLAQIAHPRESLDLLTIANLGTWANMKNLMSPRIGPPGMWDTVQKLHGVPPEGGVKVLYMTPRGLLSEGSPTPNPLYGMLQVLYWRLAIDLPGIGPIADYWAGAKVRGQGSAGGGGRSFPVEILSPEVAMVVRGGRLNPGFDYADPWATVLL
jgi:hypothetical protein